jgi:hypothetical protein
MNGSVRFAIKKIDEWTGNNTIEPSPICWYTKGKKILDNCSAL